ncbi:hypothetical protein HPB50_009191 [Hyalomma asiaticum]|uniref:Uncharacterized protein n=1 Tax=Hyalomma asiaticum TaxID=266040 RepID=A0ACB7SDF8_HYAAI|nr:hypothetical protein HPB50_009191 [Hyalomma asiaticum]
MWLHDARARNIPFNGLLLRKEAEHLAVVLGHNDVTINDEWLERFKRRYGATFEQVCGKRNGMSVNAMSEWKADDLPALLARSRGPFQLGG